MDTENSLRIQDGITRLLEDPLVKLLSTNSSLSNIQLETLLIDVLSENIYGMPLLGYLGILDSPQLQQFIEISTKLRTYIKNYFNVWNKQQKDKIENDNINDLYYFKNELIETIGRFLST